MAASVALVVAICVDCAPSGPLALGASALICAMIAVLVLLIRAARAYSTDAMATFGLALIAGSVIATTPGVSDTGADYLARVCIGLAVGAGGGVLGVVMHSRG